MSFYVAAPAIWNALQSNVIYHRSLGQFTAGLKTYLFTHVFKQLCELLLKGVSIRITFT